MNSKRNPVLLVHGIYDTVAKFQRMSAYLENLGWSIHSLNLIPNDGSQRLETLGEQVADYVERTFPAGQPLDLVGFSMGGIVSRYYLQRLGGMERVQRYVSISAPNNGTLAAYALERPGVVQMRPKNHFLQDLNRDVEALQKLNVTVLWTPFDLMILPAKSSLMSVGREIRLPVPIHAWMVSDSRTLTAVAQQLSEPLL
jgi:triacylglycerol lipase